MRIDLRVSVCSSEGGPARFSGKDVDSDYYLLSLFIMFSLPPPSPWLSVRSVLFLCLLC